MTPQFVLPSADAHLPLMKKEAANTTRKEISDLTSKKITAKGTETIEIDLPKPKSKINDEEDTEPNQPNKLSSEEIAKRRKKMFV